MKVPANRKGFLVKEVKPYNYLSENVVLKASQCVVYGVSKLSHSGISCYKVFEGFSRKVNKNSLSNLLNQTQLDYNGDEQPVQPKQTRKLNATQSRKVKKMCNKLSYYSRVRHFTSKKTGSYKFKVGFITLTSPDNTTDQQYIKAFEHFLDYLRRTAKCNYVWKKELGEQNNKFHTHILINNFIPYYIVSWKWKRLLIAEGVKWPVDENGKDTNSHYRIELPRSRKLIAHYIGKYMSKAYELPKSLGYIAGWSSILDDLKEVAFIEGELPNDEINTLFQYFRTIRDLFISHCCVNLRTVQQLAPTIYYHFMKQFEVFQEAISLEQRYYYV